VHCQEVMVNKTEARQLLAAKIAELRRHSYWNSAG
jgi:hypothetical protein